MKRVPRPNVRKRRGRRGRRRTRALVVNRALSDIRALLNFSPDAEARFRSQLQRVVISRRPFRMLTRIDIINPETYRKETT